MTLYDAIFERHSVRDYLEQPFPREIRYDLGEKADDICEEGDLNVQLVIGEKEAFSGINSYGRFHGAQNYFIMIGRKSPDLDMRVGYYGEKLVLFLQTLGLNSCWVGMTYKKVPAAYRLCDDEKIVCVIAFGYGKTSGVRHRIKTVSQVSNASEKTPEWFLKGVEAALLAPTALNQQKFSFEYMGEGENGKGLVRAQRGFSIFGYTKIDLGIAMLHFELGAGKDNFEWV